MDQFLFVGDDLALDLINTRVRVRGRERDLLATPSDVDRWWHDAAQHYPALEPSLGPAGDPQLDRIRQLRDTLREQFSSAVERRSFDPSFIARLNDVLAGSHPQIARFNGQASIVIRSDEPEERLAVAVALAAARLVTEADLERLHRCEGCILLFYDRTKSGTRHWCSTRCFDRARAQQRRARTG